MPDDLVDADLVAATRHVTIRTRRAVDSALAGAYRSMFRGQGTEFDEVREFSEGDELRAVDWKVTARLGRPFVKTYIDERDVTLLFVVDRGPSMALGFGPWSLREGAARVCATLAHSARDSHDRFGLLAFSRGVDDIVRPGYGAGHVTRVVRSALTPGRSGAPDPLRVLDTATRLSARRAIVFVVSDFMSLDAEHASLWRRALGACGRRHEVVAVPLLAPEVHDETWPERAGRVTFANPNGCRTVDFGSARVRRAYRVRIEAWHERFDDVVKHAAVERCEIRLPTGMAEAAERDVIAESLHRFFGERLRRRGRR